jgi:hypothetical protein
VKNWLDDYGLELAAHKTEAMFFIYKKKIIPPKIVLNGYKVPYSRSMRYLGIHLDDKLKFSKHVKKASSKPTAVGKQLAKPKTIIGGPKNKPQKTPERFSPFYPLV